MYVHGMVSSNSFSLRKHTQCIVTVASDTTSHHHHHFFFLVRNAFLRHEPVLVPPKKIIGPHQLKISEREDEI